MSIKDNDRGSDSRIAEGGGEVMEDQATAPLHDDAASDGANPEEDSSLPDLSEGEYNPPIAESGSKGQADQRVTSQMGGEHCGSASEDCSDMGSGDANANDETLPTGHTTTTESQDEDELVILPADEEMILPAKFIQTKAEAIGGSDHGDGHVVADTYLSEQSVQKNKGPDDQPVDSKSKYAASAEGVHANEELVAESISSDSDDLTKADKLDNQEVPTHDKLDEANEKSESTIDSNSEGEEKEATSISADETERENAGRIADAEHSRESVVDDKSNSNEQTKDGANGSSAAQSDNSQPADPSAETNSNTKDQENNVNSDPKDYVAPSDSNTTDSKIKEGDANSSDVGPDGPRQIKLVDYASKLAGAQILEQSASLKGASNLLTGDKDRYSIAPCEDKRYVIIGLSEDILVKQIKLSNYERYSSRVKDFQVLASQEYPAPNEEYWNSLGTYEAKSKSGEQAFELAVPAWARYLKFRFLSHYGSEHYCTLSQIKVHGSTMLQGFHEQWVESEKKDRELEEGVVQQDAQDGGGDEATSVEDEGGLVGEGNAGGDGQEQSHKEVDDGGQDLGESQEFVKEDPVFDEALNDRGDAEKQGEEPIAASEDDQREVEVENETLKNESDINERPDAKAVDESQQGAIADSKESQGNDKAKDVFQEEKLDKTNAFSTEANADLQALGEKEGAIQDLSKETEEIQGQASEAHENDDVPDEDSTSTSDDFDRQQDTTYAGKEADDEGAAQAELKESIPANEGADPMRNDSSIAAVTDVVKAAVADASGAIKNATSDAIKNVKDAIRTRTVTGSKGSGDEKENNIMLDEGLSGDGGAEEELRRKPQTSDTSKQDDPSSKKSDQGAETKSPPPPSEDGSIVAVTKPNSEEGPSKTKGATVTKSTDTKSSEANTAESKLEKGASVSNNDLKSAATASREMLKRGTITLAGKDGKDIDASSGELYTKLSRRFPHTSCMKDLDFQAFKSKTMLANNAGGGGGPVGPGGGGAKMEPIFTKITNEIKSVQITQNQYEQYISALKACYESVIWDVAKDLDSVQASIDQRLLSLERAVFLSEMRAKGSSPPSHDKVSELFSSLPFAVSAFQFPVTHITMPDHSQALCAGLATFLLLFLWCLPQRKKSRRGSGDAATDDSQIPAATVTGNSFSHSSAQNNVTGQRNDSVAQTPKFTAANAMLEKDICELTQKLASSNEKLSKLQTQHTTLLQEHVSLQRQYSTLTQTVASLENQVKVGQITTTGDDKSKREIKHVIFSGEDICSTPTPSVQSIQSEPVSSEKCTTPTQPGKKKIIGVSPLKNGFRKKKSQSKR